MDTDKPSPNVEALPIPVPLTGRPSFGRGVPIDVQANLKRRSSSRSIKRKRFDDEIVEYSINYTQSRGDQNRVGRPRTISQTYVPPVLQPPASTVTSSFSPPAPVENPFVTGASTSNVYNAVSSTTHVAAPSRFNRMTAALTASGKIDKRRTRTVRKSKKPGRVPNFMTTKDLGRWKPIDDLTLVVGVLQTNDLRLIHRGVKFSCKFTLPEIQTRWYTLLYEPSISRLARAAMRNLHPEQVEMVKRKALFSYAEEEHLGTIKSTDNPKLEQFQELMEKYRTVFYSSRTAKTLQDHWHMMKDYQLLSDQKIKPLQMSEEPLTFSDAEEALIDSDLNTQRDETLEIELALTDRRDKREIRLLEHELSRWHVLVDSMTNVNLPPEFDGQTLAVLRGRLVRYLMRSKEITFGRDASGCTVDVDLALEGYAGKISRRQGTIKLRSNGDFFIANEGKRPLFIDGMPLMMGNKTRMANNCVVEICSLRFVFSVNYQLINAIRRESAKTTAPLN